MTTEFDKMTRGEWYDANFDSELIQKRMMAQDLCFDLNQLKPSREEERSAVLNQLFGQSFEGLVLLSPFICDYGKNITFGKNCFINSNCYFMDGAKIALGDNVFVGPSTGFYTANHPLDYKRRNEGLEKALPITIGDNVWFGATVNVMPGVTIGSGCVIASGSVVTHDIPVNSLAAGVPCQVVRKIEQE
ncbi:TPA: sugar O-acetyltransferase [Streptococcus pyogenes]